MANGLNSSFIAVFRYVAFGSPTMEFKTNILQNVFLCENLKHSLVFGIALTQEGGSFGSNGRNIGLKFLDGENTKTDRNVIHGVVESVVLNVTTAAVLGYDMFRNQQLGHNNDRTLKYVICDSLFVGLPELLEKTVPCEDCVVAE